MHLHCEQQQKIAWIAFKKVEHKISTNLNTRPLIPFELLAASAMKLSTFIYLCAWKECENRPLALEGLRVGIWACGARDATTRRVVRQWTWRTWLLSALMNLFIGHFWGQKRCGQLQWLLSGNAEVCEVFANFFFVNIE